MLVIDESMIKYILSLLILFLSACTSQVDEQLQRAGEYYIEHRAINDSIDEVLSRMETSPGSRQDVMKRILQATYLYNKGEVERPLMLLMPSDVS